MVSGGNKSRAGKAGHNVLIAAVLLFFCQATLPYFLTNCPLYGTPAHTASARGMPPDCPMLAMVEGASKADRHAPVKSHDAAPCPLCAVASPSSGFVAAGPVSPPLPQTVAYVVFSKPVTALALRRVATAFSARAPPSRA